MQMDTILGIGALIFLIGFVFLAFRKGFSVKPSDNPPSRNDYT